MKCISRVWRPSVQSLLLSFPLAEKGGPTSRMRISRILEAICAESFVSASRCTEIGGLPGGSYFLEHVCKTVAALEPRGGPRQFSDRCRTCRNIALEAPARRAAKTGLRTFLFGNWGGIFGHLPHLPGNRSGFQNIHFGQSRDNFRTAAASVGNHSGAVLLWGLGRPDFAHLFEKYASSPLASRSLPAGLCTRVRGIRVFSSSF